MRRVDRHAPPVEAMKPGNVRHDRRRHRTGASRDRWSRRCTVSTRIARRSTSSITCSAAVCRAACSTRSANGAVSRTRSSPRPPSYADSGAWSVYAGTMPEHADEVVELIGTESRPPGRRRRSPTTNSRSPRAISPAPTRWVSRTRVPGCRASAGSSRFSDDLRSVEEQIDRWAAVSLDDVRRVIERVYGAAEPVSVSARPA